MEPVKFPTTIAPVIQTDRVKRTKPGKDPGQGSSFSRQLREEQENPSDAQASPEPEPDGLRAAEGEADSESPEAPRPSRDDGRAAAPFKKLIDVRV